MSILLEEMSETNKIKEKAKGSNSSSLLNKNQAKESENYLGEMDRKQFPVAAALKS